MLIHVFSWKRVIAEMLISLQKQKNVEFHRAFQIAYQQAKPT